MPGQQSECGGTGEGGTADGLEQADFWINVGQQVGNLIQVGTPGSGAKPWFVVWPSSFKDAYP